MTGSTVRLVPVLALLLAACADPPMTAEELDLKSGCEAQAIGVVSQCGPSSHYYASVDDANPDALRDTLHQVIDDHRRLSYTSRRTDTWDMLEEAHAETGAPGLIRDVYRDDLFSARGGGNGGYDREHVWPKSFGFPDDHRYNYPYTDGHGLYLADSGYNRSRGNRIFGWCEHWACEDRPTAGDSGSNAIHDPRGAAGTWEVWHGQRGDLARALFYMDVRYEGGRHSWNGAREPDLVLTDDRDLIDAYQTDVNTDLAYMGLLSVLLEWHRLDPPDARERARNDIIARHQGNRNPFVDHPEWVECLFEGRCGQAPAAPPWISELHYDNAGADTGEFVEIAGSAGTDLTGWTLALYNGRDGRAYTEVTLDGVIDDEAGGLGALAFPVRGIQNGGADGVALIDPDGAVAAFISYEGVLAATDGPADGFSSVDIGVRETNSTPSGHSLSRPHADAPWTGPAPATPGRLN